MVISGHSHTELNEAIIDSLRSPPVKTKGKLPVIPVDERATEVSAIRRTDFARMA
jgi:hypothetical protein